MHNANSIAIAAAATILVGCDRTGIEGGSTTQRNYTVGAFERVEISGPYKVEVRTGSAPSVSAPATLLDPLVVEVRGDDLLAVSGGPLYPGHASSRPDALDLSAAVDV